MRISNARRPRREMDLIGLINAVFLLLVFFVVSGTIQPRAPADIELAVAPDGEARPAPDSALGLDADGRWYLANAASTAADIATWLSTRDSATPVEIWVDAKLDASAFQRHLREIDGLTAQSVSVITTRLGAP